MEAPILVQELLVEDTHLVRGHSLVGCLPELFHILLSLLVKSFVVLRPETIVPSFDLISEFS